MGNETKVKQVLRMKEGTSETSYAKASYIQKQVLSSTKCIREETIRELYCKISPNLRTLCIADLGCSSNELNNMPVLHELIATVEKEHRQLGRQEPLEYQIALNDLPINDFNTVFRSLPCFEESLKQQIGNEFRNLFVYGVPGSFYGRLFPANSIHYVQSSLSLQWLSQVPKGIEENKRSIYINETSSYKVIEAYFKQFQEDILIFLQSRSKEVVPGGVMVLSILGRKTKEPYGKESSYVHDLLTLALNDMVNEGYIEEEKLKTFNMPVYLPSSTEVESLVQKEGSFDLAHVEVSKVNWTSKEFKAYDFVKCISHFGNSIIDQVFERYHNYVHASEGGAFTIITVILKRGMTRP